MVRVYVYLYIYIYIYLSFTFIFSLFLSIYLESNTVDIYNVWFHIDLFKPACKTKNYFYDFLDHIFNYITILNSPPSINIDRGAQLPRLFFLLFILYDTYKVRKSRENNIVYPHIEKFKKYIVYI